MFFFCSWLCGDITDTDIVSCESREKKLYLFGKKRKEKEEGET